MNLASDIGFLTSETTYSREIPSWKEPAVNGTDVAISLTRMEPQPCAVVCAV